MRLGAPPVAAALGGLIGLALAPSFACSPIVGTPLSEAPLNACGPEQFPCDAYVVKGAASRAQCNIDETTGQVTWFQDMSGSNIVNQQGRILTLTANEAMKYKFGKGIAATKEELAKVMGYSEFEFGGNEATKFIDENMKTNDYNEKRFNNFGTKYAMSIRAAAAIQDKVRRMPEVGLAKKHLEEMKKAIKVNPNIGLMNGVPTGWFKEQDELIKELSK